MGWLAERRSSYNFVIITREDVQLLNYFVPQGYKYEYEYEHEQSQAHFPFHWKCTVQIGNALAAKLTERHERQKQTNSK